MIVADKNISLTLTGNGDVVEPHDGIIAVGSGGNFAPPFLRSRYSLNATHLPFVHSFVRSFIHESILLVAFLGSFALACARGLIDVPGLDAEAIARKSMQVQLGPMAWHHSSFTLFFCFSFTYISLLLLLSFFLLLLIFFFCFCFCFCFVLVYM